MVRATEARPEDHQDNEDQEDAEEVVEERSTRSRTRATSNDQEQDAESSLSQQDEALSEGSSSYGDDTQFGPPNLQRLIRLGQEHCRTPCRLTNSDGVKVAGVCGQKVRDCQRHAQRRLGSNNYQYAIGSYLPVIVTRGYVGHGLASGLYYSDAQIRAFQDAEAEEMGQHVEAMVEDATDEEEMEELSRDVRVKFTSRTQLPPNRRKADAETDTYDPSKTSTTLDREGLRKSLAAYSGGHSRKESSPVHVLWFGMVGKQGARWVTSSPSEANDTVSKKQCRIGEVFHTRAAAEGWLEKEEHIPTRRPKQTSDSDDKSSVHESDEKASTKKARRRRKKNQDRKARRKKEKQKARKADYPSPRRHGHKSNEESDPSDSSDDSSKESSHSDSSSSPSSSSTRSSSSGNSSSDTSSSRRPSRHRTKSKSKASKKRGKMPKKNRTKEKDKYSKFQHEDTSTGDSQRIYGMSINGTKIDKAVAPDSMRHIDRGAMYTAAVDVTSLPGGWNSNKGVSEEMFQESQKIAQLTSTILASTNKLRGMEIQDTSWNSTIRHSLGRVKNREDLFEFVKKLRKSKKAAFRQETNLIQNYMYQRQYGGPFIREYVRSSLLCLISARSFRSFFDLGDAIRQLAFDHPNWENGPAKAMLAFHSEKLMEIRQFAVSRKQLILQIYTYLRDAQAKDFYHESMAGAIWERLSSIPAVPSHTGGGPETSRCSYCSNKEMHKLFKVLGQRDLCPVKTLPNKGKAKEAAKWIVDQKKVDPTKDIQTLLAEALTQFV